MMDLDKFQKQKQLILIIAKMSGSVETENMLAAIEAVEKIGSKVDPDLFARGKENLSATRMLVTAIQHVQRAAQALSEATQETAQKELNGLEMGEVIVDEEVDFSKEQISNILNMKNREVKPKDSCI